MAYLCNRIPIADVCNMSIISLLHLSMDWTNRSILTLLTQNLTFLRLYKNSCIITAALILAGCNPPMNQLREFDEYYHRGDFRQAQDFCDTRIKGDNDASGNNLLWALQMGLVHRCREDYNQSTLWFDRCEDMLKTFDYQIRQTDIAATTFVNDNIIPYRGKTYDGIMVNTYKALNFMTIGRDDLARVEFNRAMERQTRAKEFFNTQIQKEKDKLDKANAQKNVDYTKTTESPEVKDRIRQAYPGLYEFQAYPDFVNPFSTYLAGVFFLIQGDIDKGRDLIKEAAGMVPDNPYIQKDFEVADNWLAGSANVGPTVWVFFENGLGPKKEEFRIDLPLFLFTDRIFYAGIALPRLVQRSPVAERLSIRMGDNVIPTEVVGDMDRVIQTEFAKEYPWILTRAIIAASVKGVSQYALATSGDKNNDSGKVIAAAGIALYSWITTAADVRIWTALPKDFQAARVPMPEDGKLTIRTSQGRDIPITLNPCRFAIVYIKMITGSSEPIMNIITY